MTVSAPPRRYCVLIMQTESRCGGSSMRRGHQSAERLDRQPPFLRGEQIQAERATDEEERLFHIVRPKVHGGTQRECRGAAALPGGRRRIVFKMSLNHTPLTFEHHSLPRRRLRGMQAIAD